MLQPGRTRPRLDSLVTVCGRGDETRGLSGEGLFFMKESALWGGVEVSVGPADPQRSSSPGLIGRDSGRGGSNIRHHSSSTLTHADEWPTACFLINA